MRRVLTSAAAIVVGALWFGPGAYAAPVVTFCGPASGQTCEFGGPVMTWGVGAKNVATGHANIGSPSGLPLLQFHSDNNMMLVVTIDVSNGFATIKPNNGVSFVGLDFTIPGDAAHPNGYGFTELVVDTQDTPSGNPIDTFTFTDFVGAHSQVGANAENAPANSDNEYSTSITGGIFDEVDIHSTTGFDEVKHIELNGVCAFTDSTHTTCTPVVLQTPEPASLALFGPALGLLGTVAFARTRRRRI